MMALHIPWGHGTHWTPFLCLPVWSFLFLLDVGKLRCFNSCLSCFPWDDPGPLHRPGSLFSLPGSFCTQLGLFTNLILLFPTCLSRSVPFLLARLPPGKVQGNPGHKTIMAALGFGCQPPAYPFLLNQSPLPLALSPQCSGFCHTLPASCHFLIGDLCSSQMGRHHLQTQPCPLPPCWLSKRHQAYLLLQTFPDPRSAEDPNYTCVPLLTMSVPSVSTVCFSSFQQLNYLNFHARL